MIYFAEKERFFIINGIETIGGNQSGPELFADGVGRQSVHVDLDISSYFFIRQKLAGNNLQR